MITGKEIIVNDQDEEDKEDEENLDESPETTYSVITGEPILRSSTPVDAETPNQSSWVEDGAVNPVFVKLEKVHEQTSS